MKAKKLLSLLLALAMFVSVFSGLTVFAEDEATEEAVVKATVGSSDLTDKTDVALSFKSVITLPEGIATGTDLSGIVITGGEEDIVPTVTEGAATDGVITTIDVVTPVLANATTYTLVVPALGNNEAASFDFTTVPENYIVKEDFNGGYSTTWINKIKGKISEYVVSGESWLKDTDSDGVVDMMEGITGDSNNTIWLPTKVDLTDVDEFTFETRVRYRDPSKADTFTNEDGSLKDDNNTNNGGLLQLRGNNANNNTFSIRTNAAGFLTYGGNGGKSFATDYKLYDNTWYTIRVTFDAAEVYAKLFVMDDNGNFYEGPFKQNVYGTAWPVRPISEVKYSYGAYIRSDIDYAYMWANDKMGEVTSTVDGATDVAKRDTLNATLTFAEEITEDDIAKIAVSNNATIDATLVDENTVELAISDLEWSTNYLINVPQLGMNKADVFTFTTEREPVPTAKLFNTDLNGLENVALSFTGEIEFVKPVATGTSLAGITLSDGNEYYTLTITEGAATDGAFTKATFTTPVLKAGKTYTMSFPAIGENEAKDITFSTVPLSYFVKEDFDGGYHSWWTGKVANAILDVLVDTDSDGVVDAMGPVTGSNNNFLKFPTYLPMADATALTIETRVKYKDRDGKTYTLEDGSLKSDANTLDGGLFTIRGHNHNNYKFQIRTTEDGYMAYGGGNFASHVSDYKIYNDTWYTIKLEFNETESQAKVTITDDEGNSYEGPLMSTVYGASYPINPISDIKYSYNWFYLSTIDYINIYDANYEGKVNVTCNGADLEGAQFNKGDRVTAEVTFDDAITAEQLAQITVNGANITVADLSDDGFSATLVIDGLDKFEKTYSLVIPAFGLNAAKTVTFSTKAEAPSTKVKQNGQNIDGLTNMPIMFSPTVEFLTALAEGTDLSGATIARYDGLETNAAVTLTAGKVTDGYFATATATISGLEQNTEYVLTIPEIGANAEKKVVFKTIPENFYLIEEFDEFIVNDVYDRNSKNTAPGRVSVVTDTDGDGIKDALNYTGFLHPSFTPAPAITMPTTTTEIVLETRFKVGAGRNGLRINEDGTIKGDGDSNNGGLLRWRGVKGSSWARFTASPEGYLMYGSVSGDAFTSDYKLYNDTWYTFRIITNAAGTGYKVFVMDDNGNYYEGPYVITSYSVVMTGISAVEFPYGSYYSSTIDYLKVWDNSALGEIDILLNDATLDGMVDVEVGKPLTTTVNFMNPVTEADLADIVTDLDLDFTVAEDGLTAELVIDGIEDYNKLYSINIPQIGLNKTKTISFTTMARPIEVVYEKDGEEVTLVGATEVPTEFVATVNFLEAVPEDADINTITINGGTVDVTLAEDRMSATLNFSGLEKASAYEVSVPAFGGNNALTFKIYTVKAEYLFRAEFNGYDDDYAWYNRFETTRTRLYNDNSHVYDGCWNQTFNNTKFSAFCPTFSVKADGVKTWQGTQPLDTDKLDVEGKKHVQISTKFKFGEGEKLDGRFLYVGNNRICVGIENGVFVYASSMGSNPANTPFMVNETEYAVERNVWYTIAIDINFETSRYTVTLSDENGNIANSTTLQFINLVVNVKEIHDLRMYRSLDSAYAPVTYDYIRIIDKNYGKIDVTYDAGVPASLDGSALVPVNDNIFELTLTEVPADLSGIALVDEDGNDVEINIVTNGNDVSIIPASLAYNTKYTLTIPKEYIGTEENQVINFTTVWDANAEFVYPEGFSKDDALDVVFYGGSITYQEGWRVHTTNWIKEKFPNAVCYNESVGGTGATHGWKRMERDLLSHNPDIVFIEFAVNDANSSDTGKDVESIIRNLNKLDKPPVVILVYTTVSDFTKNKQAMQLQEEVAKHYGVATISIHDYLETRYNTEEQFKADWNSTVYIGSDRTHPTAEGGRVYGEYVVSLLNSDSSKYFVHPSANALTEPMYEDFKDYVYDATYVNKTLSNTGDSFEFEFKGDMLGIEYTRREGYGIFKVEIDGIVKAEAIDCYYEGSNAKPVRHFTGLGEGNHVVKITVTGQNEKATDDKVNIHTFYEYETATKITRPIFSKTEVVTGEPVRVYTSYQGAEAKDAILLVATYDKYGKMMRLIQTDESEFTTTVTDKETYKYVDVTPVKGEAKIKAFVWDGIDTMVPYAISTEIQ